MAVDVFLKLFNKDWQIKGSSTDSLFPNSIELKSFSMDAEATISVDSDKESGKPGEGESTEAEEPLDAFTIEIKKIFDSSSTVLFRNYAASSTKTPATTMFTKAEIFCRIAGPTIKPGMKPEQVCFLVYEFQNLWIFEYSLQTEEKSSVPIETCKFYFDKYRISYRPQLSKGELGTALKLGWDFNSDAPF